MARVCLCACKVRLKSRLEYSFLWRYLAQALFFFLLLFVSIPPLPFVLPTLASFLLCLPGMPFVKVFSLFPFQLSIFFLSITATHDCTYTVYLYYYYYALTARIHSRSNLSLFELGEKPTKKNQYQYTEKKPLFGFFFFRVSFLWSIPVVLQQNDL